MFAIKKIIRQCLLILFFLFFLFFYSSSQLNFFVYMSILNLIFKFSCLFSFLSLILPAAGWMDDEEDGREEGDKSSFSPGISTDTIFGTLDSIRFD